MTSSCAHFPINKPLAVVDPQTGYRFRNSVSATNREELLMVLAFSGGGMRAATTAFGVLEGLAQTPTGRPGQPHRLLDEVDLISSVSGGSFAAACYTLWGDRFFTDFEPLFLKKRVATGYLYSTLYPWNWVRLASSTFSRSDLAAEHYDRLLFKGATYGDLPARAGRPFLVINASDIDLGERFAFTQDQFDLIGSDLSRFPIGRAVAASAAYPVLMNPIVLKNHATESRCPVPKWIDSALADPEASDRRKSRARSQHTYLDGTRRHFIHLFDGGLTDNLGLRCVVDWAIEHENLPGALRAFNLENVRRIVVILVDAQTESEFGWNATDRSPAFTDLLRSLAQVSMSRSSEETITLFKELAQALASARKTAPAEGPESGAELYMVELNFSRIAEDAERQFFNTVPSHFQLPPETVDRLRRIAREELLRNPEFLRLVADLERSSE
jgi:NTE family protein